MKCNCPHNGVRQYFARKLAFFGKVKRMEEYETIDWARHYAETNEERR